MVVKGNYLRLSGLLSLLLFFLFLSALLQLCYPDSYHDRDYSPFFIYSKFCSIRALIFFSYFLLFLFFETERKS